jgi:hypothetical protein
MYNFCKKNEIKLNALWQHDMGNFNHVFHENSAILEILSGDIFILTLINKLCDVVCRCEYPHHVATLHSDLIMFYIKTMCRLEFYTGTFSYECSSRKHV